MDTNKNGLGGRYLIQDVDHMSEIRQTAQSVRTIPRNSTEGEAGEL